jgi:hypothetical protein
MKKKSIPGALIGIAGVHYVAAELSRRGLIALPTIRNTAAYDIIVATRDGKKHANIQVKTSQKKVSFFPMPSSDRVCAKPNDYYVFLRWLPKESNFEGFMLKGSEAKRAVTAGERDRWNRERRLSGKGIWASVHVGGKWARQAKRWKRTWDTWTLS